MIYNRAFNSLKNVFFPRSERTSADEVEWTGVEIPSDDPASWGDDERDDLEATIIEPSTTTPTAPSPGVAPRRMKDLPIEDFEPTEEDLDEIWTS